MDRENQPYYKPQRSFFGPILLITVGALFLGSNLGLIPGEGWGVIWKLWPLLLIVAGLDDLIRRRGIAWPMLLISAGAFLIYNNFGPQSWISWAQVFRLWPIVLVAAGIDVLFRDRSGWMVALGLVLTAVMIGGAVWVFSEGAVPVPSAATIRETWDTDLELFEVDLALGLGELKLADQDYPGVLISGSITPPKKAEGLETKDDTASYSLKYNQPSFYPNTARWDLGLTSELELDLTLSNGVGEVFLSLEDLQLASLNVDQGVGRLVLNLPPSEGEQLSVKQAVGMIKILIPSNLRVAVDAKNGLSRVNFPPGFELEDGYYTTPGTTKANAELLLVVEQAIGLVDIEYAR